MVSTYVDVVKVALSVKRIRLIQGLWSICFAVAFLTIGFSLNNCKPKVFRLKPRRIFNATLADYDKKGQVRVDKPFAYFIRTAKCLPSHLLEPVALGDSHMCDVYVNSYKKKCNEKGTPQHIKYHFKATKSYGTGRNLLYDKVKVAGRRYYYYVFMDENVIPTYTEHYDQFRKTLPHQQEGTQLYRDFVKSEEGLKETMQLKKDGKSAWRAFEDDLIANSPAFGVPNFIGNYFESRQTSHKYYQELCGKGKKIPLVAPTFYFDESFIAFHQDAAAVLLPYTTIFEGRNFELSGLINIIRARAFFYRQGIANYKITVVSTDHKSSSQKRIPSDLVAQYVAADGKDVQGLIDDRELYLNWNNRSNWEKTFFHSKALCMEPLKFPVRRHYMNEL